MGRRSREKKGKDKDPKKSNYALKVEKREQNFVPNIGHTSFLKNPLDERLTKEGRSLLIVELDYGLDQKMLRKYTTKELKFIKN